LSDSDLPDRVINPEDYNRDLIVPTDEGNHNWSSGDSSGNANETAY